MNCKKFFSLFGCLGLMVALPFAATAAAAAQTTEKPAAKASARSQSQSQSESQSKASTCGPEKKSEAKVTLTGKVTDADDKPLAHTRVKVASLPACKCAACPDYPGGCSCCPDGQTVTNAEGKYKFVLQPGDYNVEVGDTKKHVHIDAKDAADTTGVAATPGDVGKTGTKSTKGKTVNIKVENPT